MDSEQKEMIKEFQCSGCTCGSSPDDNCLKFEQLSTEMFRCSNHSAGIFLSGAGKIALGLPKGFNKVGALAKEVTTNIRLMTKAAEKNYNYLNIPVWALEKDGYLFIRTYSPRINCGYVDVIKGGKRLEICPNALNVEEFINDID